MNPTVALQAVAQAAAFAAIGWAAGDLLMRWIGAALGRPERWLLRFGGGVAFAVAVMVVHLVSGGRAFSNPIVVPLLAAGLVIGVEVGRGERGSRRRITSLATARRALETDRRRLVRILGAGTVLLALYVVPALIGGSGVRTGDAAWHMGWTSQLLAGEPVPVGPAPEVDHNGYPWGHHAVLATLTRLVPGSDPLVAHEALHLILVAALPLAAACLARRFHPDAGWAGAGAAALIGGFGWVLARGADFVASPTEARYGADLMVASPNSVYELFPPAFPREVGLVLVALAAVLVAVALLPQSSSGAASLPRSAGSLRSVVIAGIFVGAAGLVSVPMLLTGIAWTLAAVIIVGRGRRLLLVAVLLAPAIAVFGLWAVPVARDYAAFGGFVDVSPKLGVEWPLWTALGSWGFLAPLAAIGVIVVARSRDPQGRVLVAFGAAAAAFLVLSIARGVLGWRFGGNETLLHQGRAWPPLHLIGAAFGGIGAWTVYGIVRDRIAPRRAVVVGTAVAVIASLSLILSAVGLGGMISGDHDGFVYGHSDQAEGSFARRAAERLGPDDVLLVDAADRLTADTLAFRVFEFSGVRLARYDNPRLANNDLRIRFKDLAETYDRRMATTGFDPNVVIVESPRAGPVIDAPGAIVERGSWEEIEWVLLRR